jgi:hypothetical protein
MPRHCSQGTTFEKTNDGALGSGKAYELDADPDDAIRSRSCISHLARDRHIDGGTEIETHRHTATEMQSLLTVVPHSQKFDWVRVVKLYPHTQCRDVDDCAFMPQLRWLVLNVAMAHPKGRLAFCPSAILHGFPSQCGVGRLAEAMRPAITVDQNPYRLEQHREKPGLNTRRGAESCRWLVRRRPSGSTTAGHGSGTIA